MVVMDTRSKTFFLIQASLFELNNLFIDKCPAPTSFNDKLFNLDKLFIYFDNNLTPISPIGL